MIVGEFQVPNDCTKLQAHLLITQHAGHTWKNTGVIDVPDNSWLGRLNCDTQKNICWIWSDKSKALSYLDPSEANPSWHIEMPSILPKSLLYFDIAAPIKGFIKSILLTIMCGFITAIDFI